MAGPPRQPRYPLEPLAALCRARHHPANETHNTDTMTSIGIVIAVTGTDAAVVHRWNRRGGIPEVSADRVAVALGLHPINIWPNWGQRVEPEVAPRHLRAVS